MPHLCLGLVRGTHLGQRSIVPHQVGRTHDCRRTAIKLCRSPLAPKGSFSNRISYVNWLLLLCVAEPGSRFSPQSAFAAATSGPKRGRCDVHNGLTCTQPNGLPRSQPAPSPRRETRIRVSLSREWIALWPGYALAGCSGQRNGSPDRQMLCRTTDSFRASATRALPGPDRLAIA